MLKSTLFIRNNYGCLATEEHYTNVYVVWSVHVTINLQNYFVQFKLYENKKLLILCKK